MSLKNGGPCSVRITKSTSVLRTLASPSLRLVGLHRDFSWPEILLSLLDHWLITKSFGDSLSKNPTEEREDPYCVHKVRENQPKLSISSILIAWRSVCLQTFVHFSILSSQSYEIYYLHFPKKSEVQRH